MVLCSFSQATIFLILQDVTATLLKVSCITITLHEFPQTYQNTKIGLKNATDPRSSTHQGTLALQICSEQSDRVNVTWTTY